MGAWRKSGGLFWPEQAGWRLKPGCFGQRARVSSNKSSALAKGGELAPTNRRRWPTEAGFGGIIMSVGQRRRAGSANSVCCATEVRWVQQILSADQQRLGRSAKSAILCRAGVWRRKRKKATQGPPSLRAECDRVVCWFPSREIRGQRDGRCSRGLRRSRCDRGRGRRR